MQPAGPRLFLLPGMDGTGLLFARLIEAFGDRVAATVLPYPARASDTYEDLVRFVTDQIGDGAFAILGESFGGPLAVRVAAALPRQSRSVILAATFLESPWPRPVIQFAALGAPGWAPRSFLNWALIGSSSDSVLEDQIAEIVANAPRDIAAQRLNEVSRVDVRAAFDALTCPVTVLHGTNDFLVSHRPIEAAAQDKANTRVLLFDAPHMLLQTQAAACATVIRDIMKRI